jgi:hypothetical protein
VLSEFLPLIPDRSADFLSLLHQELKSAFQAGWKLENSEWGKVECIGPNIMLKLQIPETFDDPDFEPSIEG